MTPLENMLHSHEPLLCACGVQAEISIKAGRFCAKCYLIKKGSVSVNDISY